MKTQYIISSFAIFFLISVSCENASKDEPSPSVLEFGKLGTVQEELISSILFDLKSTDAKKSDILEIAESSILRHLSNLNLDEQGESEAKQYIKDIFRGSVDWKANVQLLSEVQREYMQTIQNAINDEENAEKAILTIKLIEQHASENLRGNDFFVVLSATSTAISQLRFWNENVSSFDKSWGSIAAKTNCVTSWRGIGNAAIAGAAGGAATCGVSRFFGPVGWKVWGACIAGGAAGAAVYEAVIQCIAPRSTSPVVSGPSYGYPVYSGKTIFF